MSLQTSQVSFLQCSILKTIDNYLKVTVVIKKCVLVGLFGIHIIISAESKSPLTTIKEEETMALSNLFGWGKKEAPASACGAGDKPEEKSTACGSACGAGDK